MKHNLTQSSIIITANYPNILQSGKATNINGNKQELQKSYDDKIQAFFY